MIFIALENVRSVYNVGSVIRTMSFFGLKNLILVGYSGRKGPNLDELHEKIKKTSLGAEDDIKIKWFKDVDGLVGWIKKRSLKLIIVEQEEKSVSFNKWKVEKDMVLVLGNEVDGVSKKAIKAADKIVEIPRLGKKGSLNVATVAGIIIEKVSSS